MGEAKRRREFEAAQPDGIPFSPRGNPPHPDRVAYIVDRHTRQRIGEIRNGKRYLYVFPKPSKDENWREAKPA